MAREAFSDEDLMAYADGELDAETARALEMALENDPVLAERLTVFTGTRDVLADLAEANPPEPLSDDMMARVRATMEKAGNRRRDNVVAIDSRPRANRALSSSQTWLPAALAASVALAIGLGIGSFLTRDSGAGLGRLQVALLEAEGLEQALSELPSGEATELPGGQLRVIASFRDVEGALCREFEFDGAGGRTVVAVTCRDGSDWDTRLAIAASSGDDASYAPASSLDTLEAYLTAIGADQALSPDEEASALRSAGN